MDFNGICLKINDCVILLQQEGLKTEAIKIKDIVGAGDSEFEVLSQVKRILRDLQYQKISNEIKHAIDEIFDAIKEKSQTKNVTLTFADLTLKKEKRYYGFLLLFSILVWSILAITIIAIPIMLIIGLFVWIGNGLLVAYLRSEAVEISEEQMPELYQSFIDACQLLGLKKVPSIYILESGGLLNAFATRHASRDFVVLYSDIIETFGSNSKELMFIIGHELGHIQRKHISKQILIMPGLLCPILAPAYSRACESSCDRYGVFVSKNLDASINAMLALVGGKSLHKELNARVFAKQHHKNRGFFVSLHEILSSYPTLSKRVADLTQINTKSKEERRVKRHSLAYFFALFSLSSARSVPFAIGLIFCIMFANSLRPVYEEWLAAIRRDLPQSLIEENEDDQFLTKNDKLFDYNEDE